METKSKRLQAKDLINVGIFTAIYFVIFFAGMMLGYIPIFIPLLGLVCPILCGIPFMLYLTKVKKFGMVTLTGVILGLLNLIMGSGVLVLVAGIIFGIASDLILRAGKYQSWKCTLLGNGVFSLWIMGYVSRMFLTRDDFFSSLVSSYGQEYWRHGRVYEFRPSVPNGLSYHFSATFKEVESGCQIYGYICRIVCAGIDGTAFIDWYMEFYFRCRCWDLYAYASRLYYGVLLGKYHDSK